MAQPANSHDPLPESTFFYRRITTWVVSLILLAIIGWNVWALHDLKWGDGIISITYWLIVMLGIVLTYYLVAPSAEQIIKVVQLSRIWKSGAIGQLIPSAPPVPPIPPIAPSPSHKAVSRDDEILDDRVIE